MEIVRDLLLAVHLVGFALLLGGLLVQIRDPEPQITAPVLWGTAVLGATGIIAAAAEYGQTEWMRSGVKFLLWLLIAVLVVANRRWAAIPRGLLWLLVAMTVATLLVATLWH